MFGYILIIVITACGGQSCSHDWPVVTMQHFNDAKSCQFASVQLNNLADRPIKAICVPEGTK